MLMNKVVYKLSNCILMKSKEV